MTVIEDKKTRYETQRVSATVSQGRQSLDLIIRGESWDDTVVLHRLQSAKSILKDLQTVINAIETGGAIVEPPKPEPTIWQQVRNWWSK
jgi:hypothetical protein